MPEIIKALELIDNRMSELNRMRNSVPIGDNRQERWAYAYEELKILRTQIGRLYIKEISDVGI